MKVVKTSQQWRKWRMHEGLFWQIWYIWRTRQICQIWRTPAKVLTKIQMTWQSPLQMAILTKMANVVKMSNIAKVHRASPWKVAILANMAKMTNLMLQGPLWLWLCIGQIEASTCPAPPGIPRAFDTFAVPGRREFNHQSLAGGGEFEFHPRFHVKSLTWRAIMGEAVS